MNALPRIIPTAPEPIQESGQDQGAILRKLIYPILHKISAFVHTNRLFKLNKTGQLATQAPTHPRQADGYTLAQEYAMGATLTTTIREWRPQYWEIKKNLLSKAAEGTTLDSRRKAKALPARPCPI
jgi:hypothetical protein